MTNFEIKSFVGVGQLKFGTSRNQIHTELGQPIRSKKDRFTSEITDFWIESGLQLAFASDVGPLQEISLYTNLTGVQFAGIQLFVEPATAVMRQLCQLDGDPRTIAGVVVFLKLGIAATGFFNEDTDDMSVTAFKAGLWNENNPKLLPFQMPKAFG
jgi:hypothetical protein